MALFSLAWALELTTEAFAANPINAGILAVAPGWLWAILFVAHLLVELALLSHVERRVLPVVRNIHAAVGLTLWLSCALVRWVTAGTPGALVAACFVSFWLLVRSGDAEFVCQRRHGD